MIGIGNGVSIKCMKERVGKVFTFTKKVQNNLLRASERKRHTQRKSSVVLRTKKILLLMLFL